MAGSSPKYPGVLPPPPGITPNVQFQQSEMNLLTQIACMVATTIFIFLRVYTKHVTSITYYADDWIAVGAWATFFLYCALCLALGPYGFGIHMWNITPDNLLKMFRLGYVVEVLYGPVVFLTKLAILTLVIRIFRVKTRFVFYIHMLIVVLTAYYTAITFAKIFVCVPAEKFWKPKVPGRCISYHDVYISDCVVSLITDFVILFAPLPVIWSLQMDLKRKLGSSFALAVGSIACVASILRLEVSIRTKTDPDKSFVFLPILLYSCGEIAIGIICSCIPILPALYRHYHNRRRNGSHWTNTASFGSRKEGTREVHKGMIPLQDTPSIIGYMTDMQPVRAEDKEELLERST